MAFIKRTFSSFKPQSRMAKIRALSTSETILQGKPATQKKIPYIIYGTGSFLNPLGF